MDTRERITRRLNEIEEERLRIIRLMEMASIVAGGTPLHKRLAELQQERRELKTRLRRSS
jgi:hypothetical protein